MDADGGLLGRFGDGTNVPSLPLKRRAAATAAAATDGPQGSRRPKTCKNEESVDKWRPEVRDEDTSEGEAGSGGSALFDYGDHFAQELSPSAPGRTNFPARVGDEDLETLKSERIAKKERLIRLTSVSLMGRPDLEDPADPIRIAVLEAAMAVAEGDAEFVLKVKPQTFIIAWGAILKTRGEPIPLI